MCSRPSGGKPTFPTCDLVQRAVDRAGASPPSRPVIWFNVQATGFQSLAGTSKAIRGMVGLDMEGLLDLARGFAGLYFETGQGSAVTNQAAEGVDMVTLEARAYGVARYLRRLI